MLLRKVEDAGDRLAELLSVPASLVRPRAERDTLQKQVAELMAHRQIPAVATGEQAPAA